MEWSPGQQTAIATVAAWLRIRHSPWFYLAGYAGSGKSVLARHLASLQHGKTAFAAFTGKAAKVMRANGCKDARTIHSLIYNTAVDPETGAITTTLDRGALDGVSLVVIDEVSMVSETVAADLLSFGKPVLVLGDPFQLPPPNDAGFFTSRRPDAMLTEVHRQAAESPIIRLATDIREGGRRWRDAVSADGLTVTDRNGLDPADVLSADAVIVGRNSTRTAYNARLRDKKGFDGPDPKVGERVICLRNDRLTGAFNGEIFEIVKKGRHSRRDGLGRLLRYTLVDPDNEARKPFPVTVFEHFFQGRAEDLPWREKYGTQEFDYAYALTAHKAQGSQWPRVCVFDESRYFKEHRAQHLYTAVTRASRHLTLVI